MAAKASWLNRTVVGVGLTSFFSDWSHEIATTILPAFLASLGAGPAALGVIEGVSDGVSSVAKLAGGYYTDHVERRKPLALVGYTLTALATGALAFTTRSAEVLLARATAWFGRGVRTPARKALMAAATPPEGYGRAFGFERMLDTLGAIVGPATAIVLLARTQNDFSSLFLFTVLPGTLAIVTFALLVREQPRSSPARAGFGAPRRPETSGLVADVRALPARYRRFLVAVGIFGLGDFAHTLLILYATQALAPQLGLARAATLAAALYLVHNAAYSAFAYIGGWLGDRWRRAPVLAAGYAVAGAMALLLILLPASLPLLVAVFFLGGLYVGVEEALEDSLAAELVPPAQHGMGFGVLAAVNAVGDFVSSLAVGWLWASVSPTAGFAYVAVLAFVGSLLVLRTTR